MSKQIERLGPILSLIPGVNIPAAILQSAYIAASQRKVEQLEAALRYEIQLLRQLIDAGRIKLADEYVRSDEFEANFMQSLRATELADSNEKLHLIASALCGCAIEGIEGASKRISMRLIEQISTEEARLLYCILNTEGLDKESTFCDIESERYLFMGLSQLGLIRYPGPLWNQESGKLYFALTPLAMEIDKICSALHTKPSGVDISNSNGNLKYQINVHKPTLW